MAKKIREQAIALKSYLDKVRSEDISENQDVQRMFCWDNAAINELIITVLTEDYIPPIILGEEELGGSLTQQYIVDGIQRTTALNKFRNMNWKTTKSFENSVIQYQSKRRDENGHLVKDENGSVLWDSCEFDIRNKTFEQLPDELKKKFDEYQIRIVIHQNCTMQEISKLVRRYNRNRSMGANQKALTWIPTYARKLKNIANNDFYKDCVTYSDPSRKGGVYEQTVANSVIATFHMEDGWKKTPKARNEYLETNSSFSEYETIEEYGNRIAKVCTNKFQDIFVFKDIPVWFAVFDNFVKAGLPDVKFAEFIYKLRKELHSVSINGHTYDSLNVESGTSDKRLITDKINTYTALMNDFLHITSKGEEVESTATFEAETENNIVGSTLDFVRENVSANVSEDDLSYYEDVLDDLTVAVDNNSKLLEQQNVKSMIAIVAYACINDIDLDDWIVDYFERNHTYIQDQKENYTYMVDDVNRFFHREENKEKTAA